MKKPNLKNINILLADSDSCLAQAVTHNLRAMGFSKISHVRNPADAITTLRTQPTSFLITEWDMKGGSGLELVRQIRRAQDSPNRTLPIIMMTGRGELQDVQRARDAGITEFVVKPFSAQALYSRIEQLIEQPRGFVVTENFVGPERRRRGLPPPGVEDRRVFKPKPVEHSRDAIKDLDPSVPIILTPDVSLRQSLGSSQALSTIITNDVLKEAQHAIDDLGEDSLTWIREDLAMIEQGIRTLQGGGYSPHAFEMIKDATLSIKSRAGTFGYTMASDIARLLFLFLTVDFLPTHPRHLVIIQKHIEVLTVIFAHKIKERVGLGAELYEELQRLIASNK